MRIDAATCDGCGRCELYCPVCAILPDAGNAFVIDEDECVECGVCLRSSGCPHGSLISSPCPWPRSLRPLFSNPLIEHRDTRVPGRGTEEMKTNDVTGRYGTGQIGLLVEVGRPGLGARLRDVERMTIALAGHGVEVHPGNPVRGLMQDPISGRLLPEVLNEKVLSVVIECVIPEERLQGAVNAVREAAGELESACEIGVIRRFSDGESPSEWIRRTGLAAAPNGKLNLAMGRAGARP